MDYYVNKTGRPTIRVGDRIKVKVRNSWIEASVAGYKAGIVVVSTKFKGLKSWYYENSELWKRDPYALEREKKQRRKEHYERLEKLKSCNSNYSLEQTKKPKTYKPQITENTAQSTPEVSLFNLSSKEDNNSKKKLRKSFENAKIIYNKFHEKKFNWKQERLEHQPTSTKTENLQEDIQKAKVLTRHERIIARQKERQIQEEKMIKLLKKGKKEYGDKFWDLLKNPEFAQSLFHPEQKKQNKVIKLNHSEQRILDLFTIERSKFDILESEQREKFLIENNYKKLDLPEDYFVHILDKKASDLRIENGPRTIFISPSEEIIVGPKKRFEDLEEKPIISEEESLNNLMRIGKGETDFSYFLNLQSLEENFPNPSLCEDQPFEDDSEYLTHNKIDDLSISKNLKKGLHRRRNECDNLSSVSNVSYQSGLNEVTYEEWDKISEYDDIDAHYTMFSIENISSRKNRKKNREPIESVNNLTSNFKVYENEKPSESCKYDYFGSSAPEYSNPFINEFGSNKYQETYDFVEDPDETDSEEIKKLYALVKEGFLTKAEFQRKKLTQQSLVY